MKLEVDRGRRAATLLIAIACSILFFALRAATAPASTTQESIFQDDPQLHMDPAGTLKRLRLLGANRVKLSMRWLGIAPSPNSHRRPRRFNASDPGAYPAGNWAVFDTIITDALQDGLSVDLAVGGGAPLWATGPGAPHDQPHYNWDPNPGEFGQFMRAVATRYSGHYVPRGATSPLPAVHFWSIWNEPDYGPSLAPQGVPAHLTIENSPRMYRNLLDAGWNALRRTGHGGDTILFGEVAPRGTPKWGLFSGMKPLIFLRALYCLDSRYRKLHGRAAAQRGCPTNGAGSSRFRRAHPALFNATAFADHPYMRWYEPDKESPPDPNYTSLGEIGRLEQALDRVQRTYGSRRQLPIYDTEFGYITSPPKHRNKYPWVTTTTAAYYLNWAEYIHWRDPRLQSFMQFLLADPLPANQASDYGGFASGLLTFSHSEKPAYSAWRMPLYLPVTSATSGRSLEVWGCVRPAYFANTDTGSPSQTVQIQFAPDSGGGFATIQSLTVSDRHGYFDTRIVFPSSGTIRVQWTYPPSDALLAPGFAVYSRHVHVTVH
jgi:hypothetical protein